MSKVMIRLFPRTNDGEWKENFEDFSLEDMGSIPNVGDTIVSPWVLQGRNRLDPADRTFFEVKRRYFLPTDLEDGTPRIALEVLERKGTPDEVVIL